MYVVVPLSMENIQLKLEEIMRGQRFPHTNYCYFSLSVAMETRVLIRNGIKPTTTFPHLNDTSDKI